MLIRNLNPFIDNLNQIILYGQNEFKIVTDGKRIITDNRYLKGIRRYIDSSGFSNYTIMNFIIMETYLQICINIMIPLKENNHLYKEKLEKYLLILNSLDGLDRFTKKYKLYSQQKFILSNLLPSIKIAYNNNFK
jgi:hypothetical protein